MTDVPRRDKRYSSGQDLLVRCDSWNEFVQLYASDVSQGGMFIVTAQSPPILSEIDIQLSLPEGHDIVLKANVVHVVDAEQAERDGTQAGIGVQFMNLDNMQKKQIHQLIEYARWDGVSDKPSASYASRMFEISAPLAPSQVLQSLPAAPAQPDASPEAVIAKPVRQRTASGSRIAAAESGPAPAGKPADPEKLKLGMTHLAHKRFDEAILVFEEALQQSPGDKQAQQWVHVSNARRHLKQNHEDRAMASYQKALLVDETNLEARKFVREYSTKKRLNAIPFGRYFVKKN